MTLTKDALWPTDRRCLFLQTYPFIGSALVAIGATFGARHLPALLGLWVLSIVCGLAFHRQLAALISASTTDSLTHLFNRRQFVRSLAHELSSATSHRSQLALLIVDVDHLKDINDLWGHHAGDDALQLVADCLRANVRASDVVSRYGGDEFTVVAAHTSQQEALILAERIRRSLRELSAANHRLPRLTVSVGVCAIDGAVAKSLTPDTLFEVADRALYASKRGGRNRTSLGATDLSCSETDEPSDSNEPSWVFGAAHQGWSQSGART